MIDVSAPISSWLPTIWYPGYRPDLPDICVGRWPADFRRSPGPDTYKLWYVETPDERQALLDALARPVPIQGRALDFASGPDRACSHQSRLRPFVALYAPPEADWPWMVVTLINGAPASMGLGRGGYAYEVFADQAQALGHMALLRSYTPDAPVMTPESVSRS